MAFIKLQPDIRVNDIYFDLKKSNIREISGYSTIIESIENILLTYPTEILFEPTFGCGIVYHIFSNFDNYVESSIKQLITKAISKWEKRIELQSNLIFINKDVDNHTLTISISYKVKSTGVTDTYKNTFGV